MKWKSRPNLYLQFGGGSKVISANSRCNLKKVHPGSIKNGYKT